MPDYDIGEAFKVIEEDLIQSMMRNMKRHRVEEIDEDKQWEMWQAKQLDALEQYKRKNRKKYNKSFQKINSSINRAINQAYVEGGMEQEIEILQEIKKRYGDNLPANLRRIRDSISRKLPFGSKQEKDFFQVDDKRVDALMKATTGDMQKAENAMLRMANDQYRKTIFNAQMYAATGAGTYEKAVDMATKDFLQAGINCIDYKDGRRVNVKSYAEMAIRTATKRAGLYADGEVRQRLGIHTVIVKKRMNACPKCLPFVDKILIDDVWSGGSRKDGDYPLMSEAIAAGFLHPNCKDHVSTYIPGVTEPPEGGFTKNEIEEVAENAKKEADQKNAELQAEKFERLAEHSLDGDNKKQYENRAKQWSNKTDDEKSTGSPEQKNTPLLANEPAEIDYRSDDKVTFKELTEWRKSFGKVTDEEYEIIGGINDNSYIKNANAYKINKAMRDGNISSLSAENQKTVETLRTVIDRNVSDRDAVLMRKVDLDYVENLFNVDTTNLRQTIEDLNTKKLDTVFTEKGFVSTSYKKDKSVVNQYGVELEIYAPEGTKMFLTKNRDESEIILQAGTKFRLEGATLTDNDKLKLIVRVDSAKQRR